MRPSKNSATISPVTSRDLFLASLSDGSLRRLTETAEPETDPKLSPDGRRLALTVLRGGNWDIWVFDLERGGETRLTFSEADDTEQIWSPDGQLIQGST